jgi:hypothetical protein
MTKLDTNHPTTSGATFSGTVASLASTNVPLGQGILPLFIPADEAYYWSSRWQENVHEAMVARERGDSIVFDSDDPNDAVRWLLSEDEEN